MPFIKMKHRLKNKFNESKQNVVNQQNVANGEGYMQGNQYVAYTPAEKEHIQGAEANKSATYTDTATNSALGVYQKTEQQQEEVVNPAIQETVLGGAGNVKTKKRKLGSASVLGGGSILGG